MSVLLLLAFSLYWRGEMRGLRFGAIWNFSLINSAPLHLHSWIRGINSRFITHLLAESCAPFYNLIYMNVPVLGVRANHPPNPPVEYNFASKDFIGNKKKSRAGPASCSTATFRGAHPPSVRIDFAYSRFSKMMHTDSSFALAILRFDLDFFFENQYRKYIAHILQISKPTRLKWVWVYTKC